MTALWITLAVVAGIFYLLYVSLIQKRNRLKGFSYSKAKQT